MKTISSSDKEMEDPVSEQNSVSSFKFKPLIQPNDSIIENFTDHYVAEKSNERTMSDL
jgi:hypothetical protein